MRTLYLSARHGMTQQGTAFYRDFQTILNTSVGPDYAIYSHLIVKIHPGDKVIVFDRDHEQLAEGLVAIHPVPSSKAGNGVQRYDIPISNLHPVSPYVAPPGVNRCGVALV